MNPTPTPDPSSDESGTAAPATASDASEPAAGAAAVVNPVGGVDPSPSTPVSRSLSALQRPWRDMLSAIGLLVIGGLVGASSTLTLLLTNVVRSLPPSAVLPRPDGSAVVVIHDPDPGAGGVNVPAPLYPDYRDDPKGSPLPHATLGGVDRYDGAPWDGSRSRQAAPPAANSDVGSNPCQGCRAWAPGGGRA